MDSGSEKGGHFINLLSVDSKLKSKDTKNDFWGSKKKNAKISSTLNLWLAYNTIIFKIVPASEINVDEAEEFN